MRKIVYTTQLLIRFYTRKIVWVGFLVLGLLLTLGCYYFVYNFEPPLATHMSAYGQVILTLGFMMMGIELQKEQQKDCINDVVSAYEKSSSFLPWCQVLAIGIVDLAVSFIIIIGCFVRLLYDGAPNLWIIQSLKYQILLYFLPCWIMGIWGLLVAHWNRGKGVYPFALLVWILTSTLFAEFTYYTREIGIGNGSFILNVLNMGINNFHFPSNYAQGAPIELPRWIARSAMFFLTTIMFAAEMNMGSFRQRKRNRYCGRACYVVCALGLMIFMFMNYDVFFTRFADPLDIQNYVYEKNDDYLPGKLVSLNSYPFEKKITQTKTEIELVCTTQGLDAEVVLQAIANEDIDGQSFTLYSDLIIDGVKVDHQDAQYERSHDGVMVYFPEVKRKGEMLTIAFRYHGYSLPIFPANETTVQLNRAFPWIPWPGLNRTSIYSNFYSYSETEDFFLQDWQRGDLIDYTLHYTGPHALYTNLVAVDNHLYNGVSENGVSLYSGMIEIKHRGTTIHMPANQYRYANNLVDGVLDAYDSIRDICMRFGAIKQPKRPESIIVVDMDPPVISDLIVQQELYSWGDDWEVRQQSGTSSYTSLVKHWYKDSVEDYQSSPEVKAKMAVAYLLNPCAGYPINVSHMATHNFAAWLSVYMRSESIDSDSLTQYADILKSEYSGNKLDFINEVETPETPLTPEQLSWIDDIVNRMKDGENFDDAYRNIYQRLVAGENVPILDMVTLLHQNGG